MSNGMLESLSKIPGAIGVAFTQNPVAGISAGQYSVAATEFTTGRLEIYVGFRALAAARQ
jgi:UDP-N-acetylenolpyruvoylglucosamine reductase